MQYKGKILSIAGSDSGGGAGIQADIKTITMLKCYAATAITAITAQNTLKVYEILNLPTDIIIKQIKAVLEDIKIDVIKIGMIPNQDIAYAISNAIPSNIPIVLDPVMVATTGANLASNDIAEAFKKYLIPKTTILTPNIIEAEQISGTTINSVIDAVNVGKSIINMDTQAVLIKGGHMPGNIINNILVTPNDVYNFSHNRVTNNNLHGTGCTLSSAIACFMAQKFNIHDSVKYAIDYIYNTIKNIDITITKGYSPVCHNYLLRSVTDNQSNI